MGAGVPFTTKFLLGLGQFIQLYWILVLCLIAGCVIAFKFFISTKKGRFLFDQWKLGIPIIGDLIKKITAARFSQTLSTLSSSGIPILISLEVVTDTIGNTVVVEALNKVSGRVKEGKSYNTPLDSDHWLRWKKMVQYLNPGGQNAKTEKIPQRT